MYPNTSDADDTVTGQIVISSVPSSDEATWLLEKILERALSSEPRGRGDGGGELTESGWCETVMAYIGWLEESWLP